MNVDPGCPLSFPVLSAACAFLILLPSAFAAESADLRPNVILSSPVTHSDWMLWSPGAFPEWGAKGVHQILDRAKACGWQRVYWRCFDGGRATYASQLMERSLLPDSDVNYHQEHGNTEVLEKLRQYDWESLDTLKEALSYGRSIGIQVHAWLSINEDDHGYGWATRYTRDHPESRWVRRDGTPFHSQQSFAFPEVRDYKLALLKEILAYGPDGIFFDWIRTGDVRDNPHTDPAGVAIHGYEEPNITRFRERFGIDPHDVPNDDPRWVRVRAEPQTLFMRDARALIRAADPTCVVSCLVQHRFGYRGSPTDTPYAGSLQGLLADIETWADEDLMDVLLAAGYYRPGGSPEQAYKEMRRLTKGKVSVTLFGWLNAGDFITSLPLAQKLRAPELLLWESNYVGLPPANDDFVKAMRDYADPPQP